LWGGSEFPGIGKQWLVAGDQWLVDADYSDWWDGGTLKAVVGLRSEKQWLVAGDQ
jgi:hypothetical protein